jgi:DNA-binding GntR family transcriptional regulator
MESFASVSSKLDQIQKPITTTEFTYNTIKEWILTGYCTPGQHINQDEFAEKMGVSRVPIRSALDKLAVEGLVVIQPRKGAMVTPISQDNLIHIFTTRCYLEPIAAMEAVDKSAPAEFLRLRELLDAQDHVSEELELMLSQNKDFHFAIFSLSRNDTLMGILENLWEQSDRYRRIYFTKPQQRERIIKDHYEITDLLCNGKKQDVADKIALHTRESLGILLRDIFNEKLSPPTIKIQSLD